jgi:hypothetical protein
MSYGRAESSAYNAFNEVFTTPAGHTGVTFVASSGDYGAWNTPQIKFLREGGAERWMAHEHGELGIGPGKPGTPAGVNIASPGITDS